MKEPARKRRARRTNDLFAGSGINRNTHLGRRLSDLTRAYMRAAGNPTDIDQQCAIVAAAELTALAEAARSGALKQNGHFDIDQVVRLQRLANAAVHKLGLDKPPPQRKSVEDVTLADIEAEHVLEVKR
jgi:hypothetical protein